MSTTTQIQRIFDPHIHMTSRTTDDYEAMYAAGVRALVEPAFWLGQPRTSVDSFVDYFDALLGWERFRAAQFGIAPPLHDRAQPQGGQRPALRRRCSTCCPRYLAKDGVVAVGEIGFDSMTAEEEKAFVRQLELAERARPARAGAHARTATSSPGPTAPSSSSRQVGLAPEHVLVDHLNELTVDVVDASGAWMGFSIYPDTKMDPHRMVAILERRGLDRVLVNSAADWGKSDPLTTVATGEAMLAAGFSADDVDRVLWRNPVAFYGQSGRLMLAGVDGAADPTATFEGNSLLRGERR